MQPCTPRGTTLYAAWVRWDGHGRCSCWARHRLREVASASEKGKRAPPPPSSNHCSPFNSSSSSASGHICFNFSTFLFSSCHRLLRRVVRMPFGRPATRPTTRRGATRAGTTQPAAFGVPMHACICIYTAGQRKSIRYPSIRVQRIPTTNSF